MYKTGFESNSRYLKGLYPTPLSGGAATRAFWLGWGRGVWPVQAHGFPKLVCGSRLRVGSPPTIGPRDSQVPSACRLHAGDEQDETYHGAGRGTLHQRLRDYTYVLSLSLLHPHRQVRPQSQHLHQQRELFLALLAGTAREPNLRRVPQQHWLPDR